MKYVPTLLIFAIGACIGFWITHFQEKREKAGKIVYDLKTDFGRITTTIQKEAWNRITVHSKYVINGKVFREKKNAPYPDLAPGRYPVRVSRFGEKNPNAAATEITLDSITAEHAKWRQKVKDIFTTQEVEEKIKAATDTENYFLRKFEYDIREDKNNPISFYTSGGDTLYVLNIWTQDTFATIRKR